MGVEASRRVNQLCSESGVCFGGEGEYPNLCPNEPDAASWSLLHKCPLENWKDGHAGGYINELFRLENVLALSSITSLSCITSISRLSIMHHYCITSFSLH